PLRNRENNYRVYSFDDVSMLVRWHYLRTLGYQLPAVRKMAKTGDKTDLLQQIQIQKRAAVSELVRNTARLSALEGMEQNLTRKKEEAFFEVLPETYFIPYYDRNDGLEQDREKLQLLSKWMSQFPISYPFHYLKYEVKEWHFLKSGVAVSKANAERLRLPVENAMLFPEKACMCFIYQSQKVHPDHSDQCEPVRMLNSKRFREVLNRNGIVESHIMYWKTLNNQIGQMDNQLIIKVYCCI
ncbi:MAG: hypothetical protein ACI3XZ_05425, partial [Butyricicoccus sp.]